MSTTATPKRNGTKAKAQEAEAKPPEKKIEETKPKGLWAKIQYAQEHAGSVAKDGRNNEHKYDYVKGEDVIALGRKAFNAAGLVAYIHIDQENVTSEEGQTRSGGKMRFATVPGALVVVDPEAEGDEQKSYEFPFVGNGTDTPGDKAVYKAITGGAKYAYMATLQLAIGDDPESGTSPDAVGEVPQGPPFGPKYEGEKLPGAIAYLVDPDPEANPDLGTAIAEAVIATVTEEAGGYLPNIAARTVLHLAARVRAEIEGTPPVDDPAPQAQAEAETDARGVPAETEGLQPAEPVEGEGVPEGQVFDPVTQQLVEKPEDEAEESATTPDDGKAASGGDPFAL